MKSNIFILFFIASALSLMSQGTPRNKEKIKVTYGIFIKKVVPNFKEATFYSEFYWWIRFKNDSTKTGWSNDAVADIDYINACMSGEDKIIETRMIGKNEYYYTGYHQGDFYFSPDYSSYPFDVQYMNISIENPVISSDQLSFLIDTASFIKAGSERRFFALSNDLLNTKNTNFNIDRSEITTQIGIYNSNFGDPDFPSHSTYSRINIGIVINRSFVPFITKLIIPLAIILLLVYFVFFIPADKIDIAAGLTVTSLLSAIAFQLSVNSDLPDIGYIIYVDKVFYSCYFLITMTMAESLYTFYLDKSGEDKKIRLAVRIDMIARFLFPLIFAGIIYLFA